MLCTDAMTESSLLASAPSALISESNLARSGAPWRSRTAYT